MKKYLSVILITLLSINLCNADMHMFVQQLPQKNIMTDGAMHIFFCGTGNPQISMQSIRKPFCLAIIADNKFLVFDAGEGSSQNLGALGLPLNKIENLFVTHLHSDHIAGIGYLNNVSWYGGRETPLTMFGPWGVDKIAGALNQMYSPDELYRSIDAQGTLDISNSLIKPKVLKVPGKGVAKPVFKTTNLTIAPFMVNHNPVYPAFGYVINYKNCKIVISGDTRVFPNLIEVADKADLLINEALSHHLGDVIKNSLKSQADSRLALKHFNQIYQYHSDTLDIAKMAAKDQIKNLVLTHLVPAIPTTKESKELFIKGMQEFYQGPITVADDRDEIVINSDGTHCDIQYKSATQPDIKTIDNIKTDNSNQN